MNPISILLSVPWERLGSAVGAKPGVVGVSSGHGPALPDTEKLADFAERWLEARLVKGKPLAPMTKQGYRGLVRRNVDPTIGQYALAEITQSVVRDWYSKLSVNAGRDQAAKSYRLVRAILNTAVDDELIGRNPCRIRGGGAEHAGERPMIDPPGVQDRPTRSRRACGALVIIAGFVGLRTGELLGLRRCDVDLDNQRLTVLVQAQQIVSKGRIVTGPKSGGRSTDGESAQGRRRGLGEAPRELRPAR